MIGVDAASGEVLWETPNPRGWKMSHASVVPMTLAGRRVYVYPALGGIVGVAADGADAGAVLWETDEWSHSVVAPSPIALDGERFLVTAGYGVGSAIFRVAGARAARWRATLERRFARTEFAAEQQTPLLAAGLVCTVMPKDGGALREQFVCMTPAGEPRVGERQGRALRPRAVPRRRRQALHPRRRRDAHARARLRDGVRAARPGKGPRRRGRLGADGDRRREAPAARLAAAALSGRAARAAPATAPGAAARGGRVGDDAL